MSMLLQVLGMLSPMAKLWMVAFVVFAIVEAITIGLVSIWFAGGALVALVTAGLGGPLWLQIVLFLVVSGLLLALVRPVVDKISVPNVTPTNADRHIGQQALVTEEINNLAETGAVRMDGVIWTARSEDGQVIPVGSTITVRRIAGVKVWVSPAVEAVSH
jgi:membrane protein implicated in regulation of membrane protease activity